MGRFSKRHIIISALEIVFTFGSLAFVWLLSLWINDYELILGPTLVTGFFIGFICLLVGMLEKRKK